jgi:flagellar biosynthesis protein FlhB
VSGEKTEKPTEQRRKKARREGTIARTPDLGSWANVLVASVVVPMVVKNVMHEGEHTYRGAVALIANPDPDRASALLKSALLGGAMAVAPLAVGLFVVALAANAAQGGLRPATKMFKPDFSRLSPFKGLKRMVGGHAVWEGAKALLKTIVLGLVMYLSLRNLVPALLHATSMPVQTLLAMIGDAIVSVLRAAALAGLGLALADYAMARRRTNKQLRMTKQEVKDEHKRSEGDPHVKGQIRARQFEMARMRMMADVSKADVVLVNPTHVAVALRYEPSRGAPRVVAKGAGAIATKIREKATEHRIPMVQDVPLARALYQGCELGNEIPPEFYGAVARVLAFIMMLKSKGSAAGTHRSVVAA